MKKVSLFRNFAFCWWLSYVYFCFHVKFYLDIENHNGSDSEYVPSEGESSDSETNSVADEVPDTTTYRTNTQKNDSSLNITLGDNRGGASAPDDADLNVATSKNATHSKKQFCYYCHTMQSKLARHLQIAHKDEEDVKKFSLLPPKNAERQQIISAIRKNGNHLYNTDRRFNSGELLVVRRPQKHMKRSAQDFVACGNCKGQYSKAVVRHHFRKCTKKVSKTERLVMVKGRKVSARVHERASDLVRTHLYPYMREDNIVRGIRYDKLITLFSNKQCDVYSAHPHMYQMVRARVRLLGRFVQAIKERNNNIKEFADVFQPRNYDDALHAVRIVAAFNSTTRTFAHPSVASNLGTLLKYCGAIIRSEYIRLELSSDQRRVEDFLKLHEEDYGASINRVVMETQLQNNRHKTVVLPSSDDIRKLHDHLKIEREKYYQQLDQQFSQESWRKLAEATLTSLQLFNRRRAGEIERTLLADFSSYQTIDKVADKDAYQGLSREGQVLAKKYVRFMIRGKRGRPVPVLIPSNFLNCMLLIRDNRSNAGVSEENDYLFGLPGKDHDRKKYLKACDLLRSFSGKCDAQVPSSLRGTQLRKHIATKCISLNLSENQVSDLANFMGHADKIHKDIYRQPILQNDILKISKLLEIAQGTQGQAQSDEESSSDEEENARPFSEHEGQQKRFKKY